MSSQRNIVLLGKIGHGKTTLLNKLCDINRVANAGFSSCTRVLQTGLTKANGVLVIDTPGVQSDEETAEHVAAQKYALESHPISGVYVVVKYARVAEISEFVGRMMDFVDDDDVRIIVTFADIAEEEDGYDSNAVKEALFNRLDVKARCIMIVGKSTSPEEVESFIVDTLHEPRSFKIGKEQLAGMESLSTGARKVEKPLKMAMAKIDAAVKFCGELVVGEAQGYGSDALVTSVQAYIVNMARESKNCMLQDVSDLTVEQQNIARGRVEVELTTGLRDFMKCSAKYLSWNLTDKRDVRNRYKRCNSCFRVLSSVMVNNGIVTCGMTSVVCDETQAPAKRRLDFDFVFSGQICSIRCLIDGENIEDRKELYKATKCLIQGDETSGRKRKAHTPSSEGCGTRLHWRTMIPVQPNYVPVWRAATHVTKKSYSTREKRQKDSKDLISHKQNSQQQRKPDTRVDSGGQNASCTQQQHKAIREADGSRQVLAEETVFSRCSSLCLCLSPATALGLVAASVSVYLFVSTHESIMDSQQQ